MHVSGGNPSNQGLIQISGEHSVCDLWCVPGETVVKQHGFYFLSVFFFLCFPILFSSLIYPVLNPSLVSSVGV